MSVWDSYRSRINAHGGNKREAALQREHRFLMDKIPGSLSYHKAIIDGKQRELAIIDSDNLDIKTLCSMPGEDLPHGGIVEWMDNHWLIIQRDANNELYTKAKMRQCNYLLRWVADDNSIIERWCIIEDGTKYLTGEYSDNDFIITRGDSRIAMIIAKDNYTIRLNRDDRFLIDDYASPNVIAYRLTKPFKLGGSYDSRGILSFVLQECNTEDTDNFELHIANYYDHFPREKDDCHIEEPTEDDNEQDGKKVWI